jgi:hypothetical protein
MREMAPPTPDQPRIKLDCSRQLQHAEPPPKAFSDDSYVLDARFVYEPVARNAASAAVESHPHCTLSGSVTALLLSPGDKGLRHLSEGPVSLY